MSLAHSENNGYILEKGNTVALLKEGKRLETICVGVNWGAIKSTGILGKLIQPKRGVDLDASAAMFKEDGSIYDVVYYHQLRSKDGAIHHSGDDNVGDEGEDDHDNEVIFVNLDQLAPEVSRIVFFINSYKGHDFAKIPYSKIGMFTGTPARPGQMFATFNLSAEDTFAGKVAMVMGKISKTEEGWAFEALGEALDSTDIQGTLNQVKEKFGK